MAPSDAARSNLYKGTEFLQYRHVELLLEGEPKFENLRARFKIEFAKGSKNVRNDDFDLYLRPLHDSRYRHMCAHSLLMIHALRHGLVVGSSIQEVLEQTANTVDGRVVWTFPGRPILCAFTIGVSLSSRWASCQISTHAIRLGAAQDIAHLAQAEALGFTTNEVRQSLGHTNNAFQQGITEAYAGSSSIMIGHNFSQQSALGFNKKAVTEDEIRDWQYRNEKPDEDRNCQKTKKRARYNIQRERHELFIKTSKPDTRKRNNASKSEATPLSQKSASEVNVISSFVASYQERQIGTETAGGRSNISPDAGNPSNFAVSAIDPSLLDPDGLSRVGVFLVIFFRQFVYEAGSCPRAYKGASTL
ncbi:hypothetical protein V1520DRAFT_327131 [Lipomyces starkeyi]